MTILDVAATWSFAKPQAARAAGLLLALAAAVSLEDASRGELAELVTDHVLDDKQPHELPAVVDEEGMADELRHDGAVARPRLDRLARTASLLLRHLLEQPFVHERAFFQRTTHVPVPFERRIYCRSVSSPRPASQNPSPRLTWARSAGRDGDDE